MCVNVDARELADGAVTRDHIEVRREGAGHRPTHRDVALVDAFHRRIVGSGARSLKVFGVAGGFNRQSYVFEFAAFTRPR